jgi:hypothetical protein
MPFRDSRVRRRYVNRIFRRCRHQNLPHPATLPDQIDDAPSAVSHLDVLIVSAASSDRRNPQPSNVANTARSCDPFFVRTPGVLRSMLAKRQPIPQRGPRATGTPLMRAISEANSGASNPSSAASTTGFRTAVIRTLILRDRTKSPGFERYAPGGHDRPSESDWSRLRRGLGDESVMAVNAARDR